MLQNYYVNEEVLCRNSEMSEDEPALNSFLQRILYHLKDNSSIICIQEIETEEEEQDVIKRMCLDIVAHVYNAFVTGKYRPIVRHTDRYIAGVLVMKVLHKQEYGRVFSRVQLVEGEAMKKCIELTGYLNRKCDIYTIFDCDIFLRFYAMCLAPQFRGRGEQQD